MTKNLAFAFLMMTLLSSCKINLIVHYPILDEYQRNQEIPVEMTVNIEECTTDTLMASRGFKCSEGTFITYLNRVRNGEENDLKGLDAALYESETKTVIAYLRKDVRYELEKQLGGNYQASNSVRLKILLENKTRLIKTVSVSGAWVNGVPTTEGQFQKFYLRPKETLTIEMNNILIGNLLRDGLSALVVIQ